MSKLDLVNGRFYNFRVVSYLPLDFIKVYLADNKVKHFAYILHDKCKLEDGTDEREHYHILISFRNARSLSSVRRELKDNGEQSMVQVSTDIAEDFIYLDHQFEKDERKYKYDHSSIVSNDISYYESLAARGEFDDKTICIINDIVNNVHPRELLRRYGRDVVMNFDKYRSFARMLVYYDVADDRKQVHVANDQGEVDNELGFVPLTLMDWK